MRTAERLAAWARTHSQVGDPSFPIQQVAASVDVKVRTHRNLDKAGRLDLDGDDVVILVASGTRTRRRFTAAHELGHYLLAAVEGVPLTTQTAERYFESYCNAFASHLLLPRPWLRTQVGNKGPDLQTALDVAHESECSLMAAVAALNSSAGWCTPLLQWRRTKTGWMVVKMIAAKNQRVIVESTASTQSLLDRAATKPQQATTQLRVAGELSEVAVETIRYGSTAYGLVTAGLNAK